MSLFISNAWAAPAPAQPGGGMMELMIMLGIFALIFYFMVYRPQAKKTKEHRNLMDALSKGDEILTTGGLVGRITKVAEDKDFLVISLNDKAEVTVQKSSVTAVLPKGTMKSL